MLNSNIFTSWKDIASYLGKGVRTVQRWERELGLPVRRPNNGKHVVVAVSNELDQWVTKLQTRTASAACCDCKVLLARANAQIADLKKENARLKQPLPKPKLNRTVGLTLAMKNGRRSSKAL